MEPIATSLWSSFRRLPPAAVPTTLDCILASTGSSPSSLFSSLLNEFPNLTKEITEGTKKLNSEQTNHIGSYVAALCHLLKKFGSNNNSVQLFIWRILIPLMELIHAYDREILDEAASLFLDVVTDTSSWDVVEAIMVPLLLRSIGLSMGMLQSDEFAIYDWSSSSIVQGFYTQLNTPEPFHSSHDKLTDVNLNNDSIVSQSYNFPLPVSCHILSLLLNAALQSKHTSGSESVEILANGSREKILAGNMLSDLSNMTLQMLSQRTEHRSSAIRFLLPFIFKAFEYNRAFEVSFHGKNHTLTREHLFVKVWKCCKVLFSLGPLERRDAYDILSLYLSFSSLTDGHEDVNGDDREETFDLRDNWEFWVEVKRGLLDKESLVRKQSLYILKTTLNLSGQGQNYSGVPEKVSDDRSSVSHSMSKRGRWADKEAKSLGVGRICNSTESSFTGWQRWEAFVFLYQMLEEYGTHLVEAAWNHQITLLLSPPFSLGNTIISCNGGIHLNQMETVKEICEWLAVLLERGFCHDNPQVRCIIMQSFLALEWSDYGSSINSVPEDFILGPFIKGLNDPVHHKDFGVKGVYSSWAIEAAAKFLSQYTSYMDGRKHIAFLVNLSSVSKNYSFGRTGLMCLAECIASAACGFLKHNDHEAELCFDAYPDKIRVKSGLENSSHYDKADLLDALRFILECCKQHFNHNYRHQVCEKILAAADSVMSSLDIPLEMLFHFISSLPREYTDYGGSLRSKVKKWLLKCDEAELLKCIGGFHKSFVSCHLPVDSLFTYDDDDLAAWGSEARRWTRVLFLVIEDEKHLDPIIACIQDHGNDICKRNNLEWLPVKFLILMSSLVQELQVIKDRTAGYRLTRRMKTETEIPRMVDSPSFVKETIFEKFTKLLFSLLAELFLYTKSSCSIFWSTVVEEDGILPASITGRLGGPSRRRLSSSVGTSVLQAVTSLKTLASVLRWCVQNGRDDASLNFSLTFLWNFCWKVITSSTCKSETEDEISMAAYEAIAYILKDLASVFSLSLDLLMKTGSSSPSDADREPILDIFLSTFIGNINNLVAGGNLARTRRAILMNWKWSCIESLLTMPNFALREGVHVKGGRFYFSDTIIRWIFGDLVESLENAGEVSVLPMLRSVRLTMELFALGRMGSVVSSCEGINTQMMWQLVHSSWILHVSCKKRRVAPIAALLSSVLHYSVFGDEGMHETDNAPGPLRWFVEKILEEGTKSPRTIRLAALHLTGLWLANPITIKFYMKELKLLTLYGSVAFDEDFEAEVAENHDAKNEVSLLSKSLDPELTEEFINTELYARVSVAVMFNKLADMADLVSSTGENTNGLAGIASGKMFLLELLNFVVNDKDLAKELYKKYSAIHRRKVRAWQMICVLSQFVDQENVEKVTSSLHISIYRSNFPSVRQYMETFAIQIYLKFPLLVGQQLVPLLRNYNLRTQALSSYVFIAANIILHSKEEIQSRHLDELLPPIIPLLTSHHHTLRGFTQILVYHVLQKLLPSSDGGSSFTMSLEKRCFEDLKFYLEHNSDCARLRVSMDGYIDAFDPMKSILPAGIFTNRVEELEFECVPATLMDRVTNFLNDTREDLRCSMANDAASIKNDSFRTNDDPKCTEMLNSNEGELLIQLPKDISYDFQRKISFPRHEMQEMASTSFWDNKSSYRSLLDIENEDQLLDNLLLSRSMATDKLRASRQQIILVASLIDRIPNLAGLARTCEVFRAAGLAVADKSILKDKQFQLISVTAEKWVPVVEVPERSLKIFLEKKKKEGFALFGLEQTANSIPLDRCVFPTKTVLVLGREKEGIPVEIIHMLDACVEIPQLGVVRSLNVHISCHGRKIVIVAIYIETLRRTHQHQRRYDHFPRVTHVHNNSYNRKAELLKYTRHLRESNHSAGASSITCMKHPPKVQITHADRTTSKTRSGRTPTYVGNWKFLLPNIFGCMTKDSETKKMTTTTKMKGNFMSKLFATLRKN
ncbi:unnamed protein product [Fraxinus pennsylvanica]|uniref:tRNA/rRNA methyltransferase SpoU type domain-containing protein n=1 Tax=Fraxinus pennsylvanica TaxID=56036 RepID=A0AAD1ZMZ1_9LAMI|nr:unnamed protein product [Fraxinus pennsylvanica]